MAGNNRPAPAMAIRTSNRANGTRFDTGVRIAWTRGYTDDEYACSTHAVDSGARAAAAASTISAARQIMRDPLYQPRGTSATVGIDGRGWGPGGLRRRMARLVHR